MLPAIQAGDVPPAWWSVTGLSIVLPEGMGEGLRPSPTTARRTMCKEFWIAGLTSLPNMSSESCTTGGRTSRLRLPSKENLRVASVRSISTREKLCVYDTSQRTHPNGKGSKTTWSLWMGYSMDPPSHIVRRTYAARTISLFRSSPSDRVVFSVEARNDLLWPA